MSTVSEQPYHHLTDEQLLDRFKQGEQDVFGLIVRRYEKELFGYLRRYLRDVSLAEDVFQNTFLQIYKKIDQYQSGKPFRPWLYTIATRQAIDVLRKEGRRVTISLDQNPNPENNGDMKSLVDLVTSQELNPFEHLNRKERQALVRDSVDRLPDHLRITLLLAYFQGLKYREVAEILSIPVGTVKSRMHLALIKLNEIWQQSGMLYDT